MLFLTACDSSATQTSDQFGSVGFIALFGVAVLNGVMLVSYIREKQAACMDTLESAVETTKVRLLPVRMTALVAPAVYRWFAQTPKTEG